jgi:hypothetical protein
MCFRRKDGSRPLCNSDCAGLDEVPVAAVRFAAQPTYTLSVFQRTPKNVRLRHRQHPKSTQSFHQNTCFLVYTRATGRTEFSLLRYCWIRKPVPNWNVQINMGINTTEWMSDFLLFDDHLLQGHFCSAASSLVTHTREVSLSLRGELYDKTHDFPIQIWSILSNCRDVYVRI